MRKKSIQRIPTELEMEFNTQEELDEIKRNNIFIDFVLNEALEAVEFAINNSKKEIILFDIIYSSDSLVIDRSQYSKIIDKHILINQEKENYEECERLTKLKASL